MAFPDDPAGLEFALAYGANLSTDLTALTYGANLAGNHVRPQLMITRGRVRRAIQTQPNAIDFEVMNPGGTYSPRNISGPNYGRLRRNTPGRVRLAGLDTRCIAYLPDWPVRWDGPGIADRIPLQAIGALSRLTASRDSRSALNRTITSWAPKAYWPLEDSFGAAGGGSAVRSVGLMRPANDGSVVRFGSIIDLPGGLPAPDVSEGSLVGRPYGISSTSWHLQLAVKSGLSAAPAGLGAFRIRTSASTMNVLHFFLPVVGNDQVQVFIDDDGAIGPLVGLNITPAGTWADRWHHIGITATQSGGNVNYRLYVDGVASFPNSAAGTLAAPSLIELNHNWSFGTTTIESFAHVAFGDGALPASYYDAVLGFAGEEAAVRAARLATEAGVAIDVAAGASEPMGVQRSGTLIDLLRECETTDQGTLVERRTGQLGFDPRSSRYNRSVTMTLNYLTQVADLALDDSDRDLVNYMTVQRIDGAKATVEQEEGPLGTDPATGVGTYPGSPPDRSLAADEQAQQHAAYLVAKGTVDEPRLTISVNIKARPELRTQWLACDIGSRIQVLNPPAEHLGPAPLDLVVEGYVELLDSVEWSVTIWCSPYRINEVLQIETGTGNRSRIPAGVSTTDLAYSATATSLSVTSAAVRWIDSAAKPAVFPMVIEIADEAMTCTAIVGTGLTQTFTVTRGLHGVAKPLPLNSRVQIWRAPCIAL